MLVFIAQSDRWSAGANPFSVKLEDSFDPRRSAIDAEVDQTIVDAFGAHRPGNWERLRVPFGIRYYDMDTKMAFSDLLGIRVSSGETWIDPVIGLMC